MSDQELLEWLFANGGPILRHRVAVDLMPALTRAERQRHLQDALTTPQVQQWLDNLSQAHAIHGHLDIHAENALAKLIEYGLHRGVPALDERVQPLLKRKLETWDPLVLYPFLARAGYADHPPVAEWLAFRIEQLYQTARRGNFDFYLSPAETAGAPKAWQGKPIYRDEFGHEAGYALPTCYDLYALAYCPPNLGMAHLSRKLEAIVAFLCDPRFQATVGGYGWDKSHRRCYAAGRVFLACVEPVRLVLFLELSARFAAARRSAWYRQGMLTLAHYRTPQGTWRFPPNLLVEKTGYYLYGGAHMGLGENRRSPREL